MEGYGYYFFVVAKSDGESASGLEITPLPLFAHSSIVVLAATDTCISGSVLQGGTTKKSLSSWDLFIALLFPMSSR